MTSGDTLPAGEFLLRRATPHDYDALVALQHAAYARNRGLLGVEPIPLLADYHAILQEKEVWLACEETSCVGALVLERRDDDLMVESIATDPAAQSRGLGRAMLAAAEAQARILGYGVVRLYTGKPLTHLINWYGRHGYVIEREEPLSDRTIVHMMKRLDF